MDQRFVCVRRPTRGVVAGALCFLIGMSPAVAASRQVRANRDAQENAARKACLIGDYGNGVAILADLFIKHRDPAYIFNQGRCLEQNLRYRDALGRFEEFLRISEGTKGDLDARAEAHKHINDCRAKLMDEEKSQVRPTEPALDSPLRSTPQPLPEPAPTTAIIQGSNASPEPAKGGKGLVIAGMVTGGLGIAAAITGVAFNIKANTMANEMETTVDGYTPSKDTSQKTYQSLAWVGYGVGAACVLTGTILTIVGLGRSSAGAKVALAPTASPNHAGVVFRGVF